MQITINEEAIKNALQHIEATSEILNKQAQADDAVAERVPVVLGVLKAAGFVTAASEKKAKENLGNHLMALAMLERIAQTAIEKKAETNAAVVPIGGPNVDRNNSLDKSADYSEANKRWFTSLGINLS